ncbi:MAG: hypothetical protein ACFBQW_01895 [Sphingomonadaceae bacterium]
MADIKPFARYAAIDWSGARGKRHRGIAVAICGRGGKAPRLVRPGHIWSRGEVRDWLLDAAIEAPTLFGFDFSFAPPIAGRGAYLPGEEAVPAAAKPFWAYVDARCGDEDLGAASFLERHHRRHFYFGAADGRKADFLHHRVCERAFNAIGGGKASTVYDAIGAAQVAKASFAGMRLLNRIAGDIPIWPFDPPVAGKSLVVEIYTRLFLRLAGRSGRKIRTREELDRALAAFGSEPAALAAHPSDHHSDALIAAAGLRAIAGDPACWRPAGLTPRLAATEGWTFGIA